MINLKLLIDIFKRIIFIIYNFQRLTKMQYRAKAATIPKILLIFLLLNKWIIFSRGLNILSFITGVYPEIEGYTAQELYFEVNAEPVSSFFVSIIFTECDYCIVISSTFWRFSQFGAFIKHSFSCQRRTLNYS